MSEEPGIVFSVKELIGRLDGKLDLMMKILTDKADRADVSALEHRLDQVEKTVTTISTQGKQRQEIQQEYSNNRRWIITTVISLAVAAVALAGFVFAVLHGS